MKEYEIFYWTVIQNYFGRRYHRSILGRVEAYSEKHALEIAEEEYGSTLEHGYKLHARYIY